MENIQNSAVEELPIPMSKDIKVPRKRTPPTEDEIILEIEQTANEGRQTEPKQQHKTHAADEDDSSDDVDVVDNNNSSSNTTQPQKRRSNNNGGNSRRTRSKQPKTTGSGATTSEGDNDNADGDVVAEPPTKNYANNYQNNNGAMDDFKYPYEKYSKEANFRYDDGAYSDEDESAADAGGAGYFYDPETGHRFQPTDDDWHERVHERVRRASGASGSSSRREDNKNTCSLYIQTDPLIWKHIREGIADVSRAINYDYNIKHLYLFV